MSNVLIFGASGTLGSACVREFSGPEWQVHQIGRDFSQLVNMNNVSAAVWAQGANFSGSLLETPDEVWQELWEANVHHIIKSVQILLNSNALLPGARLVLVSSVWQEIARSNKLAYIATKSAVGGLIRGLSAELGPRDIAVNGVLPGVIDTPMTRKNLSVKQIEEIQAGTPAGELVSPEELARVVRFLASKDSKGINGQSIFVDNGWALSRNV